MVESRFVFDEDRAVGIDHHFFDGGIAEPFLECASTCDVRNGTPREMVVLVVAEERCGAAKVHFRRREEVTALVAKLLSERAGESVRRGHSGRALKWVHRGGKPRGEESCVDHTREAWIEIDFGDDGCSEYRRHVAAGE